MSLPSQFEDERARPASRSSATERSAPPFGLRCSAFPRPLSALAIRGSEELGRCFDYEVYFAVDDESASEIKVAHVLGATAIATLGGVRTCGLVAELELLEEPAQPVYRMRIVPGLWFLRHSRHSRVFVDRTVPEVLKTVLDGAGLAGGYDLRLTSDYRAREHIGQYDESDLDFVERWMQREGMYYYFDQTRDDGRLVIVDGRPLHAALADAPIPYEPAVGRSALAGGTIDAFREVYKVAPKTVGTSDYNYLTPDVAIRGSAPVSSEIAVQAQYWAENVADRPAALQAAKLGAARELSARARYFASGLAAPILSGFTFSLARHPMQSLNREYLAVRVARRGRVAGDLDLSAILRDFPELTDIEGDAIRVDFEAVPADAPFVPPRRSPWPRVPGFELARVDGPADGEYAQLDDQGRYLVKLMMDENDSRAGRASMRVRKIEPHAGAPEGWHLPLRKGTEVLVAFVGGDPDRPVIVGAAPNTATPSPVTSANQTFNVAQTGGLSRVEIEDAEGKQYIDVSTPPEQTYLHLGAHGGKGDHNVALSTQGDGLVTTGGNRDIVVGAVRSETVQSAVTEHVHGSATRHVTAALAETVDASASQTVHSGRVQTITGGYTRSVTGGETRSVSGGVSETLRGDRTQTIQGASTESVTGTQTQTITGGATILATGGAYTLQADGGITLTTTGKMNLFAKSFTANAPGGITTIDSNKTTTATTEFKGYKLLLSGIQGINISVAGLSMAATGVRRDTALWKFEYDPISIDFRAASNAAIIGYSETISAAAMIFAGIFTIV
jgi:type VI secretion system secreted protein VgrG